MKIYLAGKMDDQKVRFVFKHFESQNGQKNIHDLEMRAKLGIYPVVTQKNKKWTFLTSDKMDTL